ncbi:MAG TPA: hypothetical protein VK427_10060, partial [Kofleriaceae bacterium]|nr:hypothetical protein [Kofleriaceae bacterium]
MTEIGLPYGNRSFRLNTAMHWKDLSFFEPLVDRLAQLDLQLDRLDEAVTSSADPDAFGLLDALEALVCEGFLLCQLYMIERKGKPRAENPYTCGPRHNGQYVAQLINAAGNYHKHRGEWPEEAQWGPQQHNTVALLRGAGVEGSDYRLS